MEEDMDKVKILHDGGPLEPIEAMILAAVKQIKYGKVEVTVHDSRVVQLETTDKVRFHMGKSPEGTSVAEESSE
jgi:hypothetical protein